MGEASSEPPVTGNHAAFQNLPWLAGKSLCARSQSPTTRGGQLWGGWARAKLQPIPVQVQVLLPPHRHHHHPKRSLACDPLGWQSCCCVRFFSGSDVSERGITYPGLNDVPLYGGGAAPPVQGHDVSPPGAPLATISYKRFQAQLANLPRILSMALLSTPIWGMQPSLPPCSRDGRGYVATLISPQLQTWDLRTKAVMAGVGLSEVKVNTSMSGHGALAQSWMRICRAKMDALTPTMGLKGQGSSLPVDKRVDPVAMLGTQSWGGLRAGLSEECAKQLSTPGVLLQMRFVADSVLGIREAEQMN